MATMCTQKVQKDVWDILYSFQKTHRNMAAYSEWRCSTGNRYVKGGAFINIDFELLPIS